MQKTKLFRVIGIRLLLLTVAFFSSTLAVCEENDSSSDEVRVGILDAEQQNQQALSKELAADEIVWLEVQYPEQQGLVNVLALEQPPRVPLVQGAVLLLHGKEQHANWPDVIRTLRLGLPDSGWYTLSVNLPHDNARAVPERTLMAKQSEQIILNETLKQSLMKRAPREAVNEEQTDRQDEEITQDAIETSPPEEPGNDSSLETVDIDLADKSANPEQTLPYQDRARQHVQAAIDHIRNEGYQNIVMIAYRAGADLALDHIKPIAQQIPEQGFTLVMIDPVLRHDYQSDIAQALGRDFKATVLDIIDGVDLSGRDAAVERESGARMANALRYQQIKLVIGDSEASQQSLLRRVRLWLQKYAPGMFTTNRPGPPVTWLPLSRQSYSG